ncbi:COG3904 Predicted periplasmic protein [Paracoccaceae bacterium]
MDGEYVGLSRRGDEEVPDHNVLADIVFENPDIDTVFLTGQGGWSYSAVLMNRNIQWAGLNTVAYKECLSACAVVFIGGAERTLAKGGILGFHRAGTHVGELEEYYTSVRAEKGWTNEFQFAEWNFEAGQIHARDMLALIVENGISPMLAVNMLSVDKDDIWRPTEDELMELRVITDGQTETEDFSDVP